MEFGISLYDALVSASVPPDKAKAVVQTMETEMVERLATKQDLQGVKQDLTLQMQALKQEFSLQMHALRQELALQLTLRMGAMLVAGITIVVGLLKLLP